MTTPSVTLYTTPGCSACAAVKRYFDQHEVSYAEKDVTADPAHLEEMTRVAGVRVAPVTVIGNEAFYGSFEQQRPKLDAALSNLSSLSKKSKESAPQVASKGERQ